MGSGRQLALAAGLVASVEADETVELYRTSVAGDPLAVASYTWLSDLGYAPTDHERQLLDAPADPEPDDSAV
jgi:hypothetical protein